MQQPASAAPTQGLGNYGAVRGFLRTFLESLHTFKHKETCLKLHFMHEHRMHCDNTINPTQTPDTLLIFTC